MKSSLNNIYCLDASALITFHRYYSITMLPDLWKELKNLFTAGTAFSHEIVYSEIVPDSSELDELAKWIKNLKPFFTSITQRQLQILPDILKNFPRLINSESKKEQADPWLIAMLIEKNESIFSEMYKYIMVTAENENSTIKLPAACRHYNIDHMNLKQFFDANGWKLSITKA